MAVKEVQGVGVAGQVFAAQVSQVQVDEITKLFLALPEKKQKKVLDALY